jgi:hypothetical protein
MLDVVSLERAARPCPDVCTCAYAPWARRQQGVAPTDRSGFFHAAALTGRTLEHVLEWVANPVSVEEPAEILRQHPDAAAFWDGLLAGALQGSPDTGGRLGSVRLPAAPPTTCSPCAPS